LWDPEDMVVVTMRTNYDVLFLVIRVQGKVVVGRDREGLEVLAQGGDSEVHAAGGVAPSVGYEEVGWVEFDVDVWLFAVGIVFDNEKCRSVYSSADEACGWW